MDPAEYQKRMQALIGSTGHMHVSGITHPGVSSASSTSIVHEDPRTEKIRLFPSRKITLPKLPAEWNNLPNFTELEVSKDDFADDEWKGIPAIRLVTLSDTSTVDLGIKVLARLGTGVSQKDIGAIFLLAFQLRQEGGGDTRRVFPNDDLRLVNDVDYGDLNEGIIIDTGRNPEPLHRMVDTNEEAKGASFLAASLLRLFTKSPGNFISAWHRIRKGYSDFYGKPLALTGGIVHPEVINIMHKQFSLSTLFKATLYRILYASNSNSANRGLKGFLYDMHLSHTGMHILPMFIRVIGRLNCSTGVLLTTLRRRRYERQINAMNKILKYMMDSTGPHKRSMWRYGRIFDQTFMSVLQTKRCPQLVMILGWVLMKESPDTSKSIMEIEQLKHVNEENKLKCENAAIKLIRMVRENGRKDGDSAIGDSQLNI